MKEWIAEQYKNAFLWMPFIMALGAAIYFTSNNTICVAAIVGAILIIIFGTIRKNKYAITAGATLLFAMAYAVIYTHAIATPRIHHPMREIEISGRVNKIDYTPDKTRLFISVPATQIKSKAHGHATVRINISDDTIVNIGDTITATASLFPPAPSYAPETFDYARWAYFNDLSATGFASDISITGHQNANEINILRNYLHTAGGSFLADTLVLGYKNAIPRDQGAIWTAAGIGHVWSISGFHMTLVSGWLFAIFYMIFRMIPYITRRIPARIPALICAWAGLLFYLFLSGLDVATIRAFLMTSLIFAAFIINRNAFSMRNICIAFCIIFLINPHYIMQPGFQLSFSAIFGLVWFWNSRRLHKTTVIGKAGYAIYAAAATSVIATLFTAPFVVAHFYSMPLYSLIGNLVLLPIFSFIIMPLVVIGTISAPIGWHWPLAFADTIYFHTLNIAEKISQMPYANILMPHIPNIAVILIIIGFLCIMFLRAHPHASNILTKHINLIVGATFICAGIIVTATTPRPVFYASPDHVLVAFSYDGKLEFNKSKSSGHLFAFDTWKQLNNEPIGTPNTRRAGDHGVWLYGNKNFRVAYIQKFIPLSREINRLCHDKEIDYIVSYFDIDAPKCNHKILRGGFVIYPSGRVRINSPVRPWNNLHR